MASLIRMLIPSDQGSILMISFNLDYFPRGPIFKYSHLGKGERVGLPHMIFVEGGGTHIQPIADTV